MRMMIAVMALLMLPVAHALSYSAVFNYEGNTFILEDIMVIGAAPAPPSSGNDYTARILSSGGAVLFETTFNLPTEGLYSIPLDKSMAERSHPARKTSFDLLLPYYSNAKTLQILKDGSLLFEADLAAFSICNEDGKCDASESPDACPRDCTCGNGNCETSESYHRCSTDCASGRPDSYCDSLADGTCDPDCGAGEDSDCKEKSQAGNMLYLLLGMVLVGGAAAIALRKRKK